MLLFPVPGFKGDINLYASWFSAAAASGPRTFYQVVPNCDYPPLDVYLFWAVGSVAGSLGILGTSLQSYAVKALPSLFDVATAALIFAFLRRRVGFRWGIVAAALYAINPAVLYDSAVWGQFDSIYTFFLILSLVLFLGKKPWLSAGVFALAALTKPQSGALAPLMAYLFWREYDVKGLLKAGLAGAVTVLAVILPLQWDNPVTFLVDVYFRGYSEYPYTSVNAFNLWGLGGTWRLDTQIVLFTNLFIIGWGMFTLLAGFVLLNLDEHRHEGEEALVLFTAFLLLFGFFMLPTRIHERYLFPTLAILALLIPLASKTRVLLVALTATLLVNEAYVMNFLNAGVVVVPLDAVSVSVSIVNVIVLIYAVWLMRRSLGGSPVTSSPTS